MLKNSPEFRRMLQPPADFSAGIFAAVHRLVGNTPMLAIDARFHGRVRRVHVKAEQLNFTGSIKDRMALFILQRAYAEGRIQAGDTIVEASSGNTGIAFAALGSALRHPVRIFMPDWMSRERRNLIQSLGADIVLVTPEQGGFLGSIQMAEEFASKNGHVFLPRQFSNEANIDAHASTTGPEIWEQLQGASLTPDAFVAGVGTGGTVMGVGRYLRSRHTRVRVHPVEPAESPTLTAGRKIGHHRIQGISDEFVPPIVQLDGLDTVIAVHDGDAILMAQQLARRLGLAVGISSGANFLAALAAHEQISGDPVVVTAFPDDNKKYLTTALLGVEPVKEGYLSPDVELLGMSSINRVCAACS